MANIIEQLDAQIASLLSGWNLLTTLLSLVLLAFAAYPILYPEEPDTHPLLLARQSAASPVRNKNESARYRSPEVPHDYPLKTGLNVKDAGAPKWAAGRDGDLRDVWREVQKGGSMGEDGKEIPTGLIMTVYGRAQVTEHDAAEMSKEINIMGQHFRDVGVKKVAICPPNGVEYLETLFACAFYNLTPVLLPYNLAPAQLYELLNTIGADALVCPAGNLPEDDLAQQCKGLRLLTWVVEPASRDMDWGGAPESAAGRLKVSVWHDVISKQINQASAELPPNSKDEKPSDVITVWQPSASSPALPEIVTFTQANLISATASLISALPLRQRLTSADMVLPADTFSHTYTLCLTLGALYTHASLALNSVASRGVALGAATQGIAPTVIIASAETLAKLHEKETAGLTSAAQRLGKYTQAQAMSAGRMPTDGLLFRLLAPSSSSAGNTPGKLRLLLTSERVGADCPPISSTMLSDLRIFTRARICYALTAAKVAGAVAQSNVFDYRREDGVQASHFGLPLSSVEIKLVNPNDAEVATSQPKGEIVVSGAAVAGGEVKLDITGRVREDGTLAYA